MNNNSNSVNQGLLFIVILLFFVVAGVVAYLVYQNYQLQEKIAVMAPADQVEPTTLPQETSTPTEEAVSPAATTSDSELPADWQTYTSEEHGFQVSFPADWQALDSEDDLYGWPNAVVLLYRGGQAYDIPVEVWDTAAKYEEKYEGQFEYVVEEINGKYVTIANYTDAEEFADIAASFQVIE